MIKSMTGFGSLTFDWLSSQITIEIKSLNSKQSDIYYRGISLLNEREFEIRNRIASALIRGKININISQKKQAGNTSIKINQELAKKYIEQLKFIAEESGIPNNDLLSTVINIQDVMVQEEQELEEQDMNLFYSKLDEVVNKLNTFRINEGEAMEKDMNQRVSNISLSLEKIPQFEEERIIKTRSKIESELNKLSTGDYDKNRFEEEMIYYLEKLDISEEKVRLNHHLKHFIDCMNEDGPHGKKLNFIAQEMGREINTIGSKASHHQIQYIVVQMKDDLEKIKEQVLNIL